MQINKIIPILLILIASAFGCNNKGGEQRFNIAGVIKNAANQKIMLQEIPFGSKPIVTLDSVTLDEKGNYSFDFIAKEQGIYRIANEKDMEIIFINDEKDIQINAKTINLTTYFTSGTTIYTVQTTDGINRSKSLTSNLISLVIPLTDLSYNPATGLLSWSSLLSSFIISNGTTTATTNAKNINLLDSFTKKH